MPPLPILTPCQNIPWTPSDGRWRNLAFSSQTHPWPWGCQREAVISPGPLCTLLPMPRKGAPYLQEMAVLPRATCTQGREELGTSPPPSLGRAAQKEAQRVLYLPATEKSVTPGNMASLLAWAHPHLSPPSGHAELPHALSLGAGFYITLIVNQWWAQYTSIPLPGQLMCIISSNVHGKDEKGWMLWCTLIHYANLSVVLILRSVSTRVLKPFPTMDHVVEDSEKLKPGGDGLQCGVRAGGHRCVPVTGRVCWWLGILANIPAPNCPAHRVASSHRCSPLKSPMSPLPRACLQGMEFHLENPVFPLGMVPKRSLPTNTGATALRLCPTAGFMTQDERKKFESLHSDFNKYRIPCVWFTNLAAHTRWDGHIHDDMALHLLMDVSWHQLHGADQAPCKARVTCPCPLCPEAESLPGQVQHAVPLQLDQHPSVVHAGGYPCTPWAP